MGQVAEAEEPGIEVCEAACGEVGSVVVAGSLAGCWPLAFGVEEARCMGLEGMGCRADWERVRNAAPREVEVSLEVRRSSSLCVVGGGGHSLIVEVVKVCLEVLMPVASVSQVECRWLLAQPRTWRGEGALPQDA